MALRWGYSLNCWTHCTNSVRKDNNERNIKVCAAGGFEGIEMQIGFGRWKPLGRPDIIKQIYGEPEIFKKYLENLGIKDIVAWDYDAAMFDFMSPGTRGYEPSCASDTDEIVSILKEFAEFMKVCSCKYLVVRPVGSFWRIAPLDEKKLQIAANCWNAVGEMTARYGVKVLLHFDWFCGANSPEAIDFLLANTNPAYVGLCIDTAELAIVGMDTIEIYEKYVDRTEMFHFQQVVDTDILEERKKTFAEDILTGGGERLVNRWYYEMDCLEKQGQVDFEKLMRVIKKNQYNGWIVVECKQSPEPASSVLYNSWYVKNVLQRI